ncbi:putative pyruvyl transferase [Calothrix sp. NIES-2100]|uniref:polysaccharide pyruvyl transferase family protein n=1 Tax=Calothrix sp. NIES-2100 TaxID=1954172 RepID=UPI000B5FA691|nr:putative pyruvyl transferase [Calothrix sp. NIES-2100]
MKVCAYSTCNESYIQNSVVSLLSIRKWNCDIDLFIISRKLSEKAKAFASRYNISVIELNLDYQFPKSFSYPVECYYLFAGPECFLERGYEYSIYIDGDIYCNASVSIDWNKLNYFAGVSIGKIEDLLKNDLETIFRIWKYKSIPEYRVQTGVIYFKNETMVATDFLEKITNLYSESIVNSIPRSGDDSLFSLFQLIYPEIKPLLIHEDFNYILSPPKVYRNSPDYLTFAEEKINNCVFFHFTNKVSKPWIKCSYFSCYTEKYFHKKWQNCLIDVLSTDDISTYFPQFNKFLDLEKVKFYWWGSTNVGDLVTPYYLQRVCKVENVDAMRAEESSLSKKPSLLDSNFSFFKKKLAKFLRLSNIKPKMIISTGSIMRLCSYSVTVYGSGIRSANQKLNPGIIEFVRGPLTRKALLKIKCECPPIYGDPGLIISKYYQPKSNTKKYSLGIIPHFTEYQEVAHLYQNDQNVRVINMASGDIEKVIDEIVLCSAIISSSLHGIVFSNSYSIPVRWIKFSNRVFGDDTKFKDYFLSIGRPLEDYINAIEFKYVSVDKLLQLITPYHINIDINRLEDALFFDKFGFKKSTFWLADEKL